MVKRLGNWSGTSKVLKNGGETEVLLVGYRRVLVEIRPRPHSVSGSVVCYNLQIRELEQQRWVLGEQDLKRFVLEEKNRSENTERLSLCFSKFKPKPVVVFSS